MNPDPEPAGLNTLRAARWQRLVRRTCTRINFGWLAAAFTPLCLGFAVLACVLLLLLRALHRLPSAAHPACLAGLAAALLLLPALAWLRARRRFVSGDQACTRLDAHLGWNNALTAARQGLCPYPPPPPPPAPGPATADGLAWNWPHLALPPVLSILLVAFPFLLPPLPHLPPPLPPNEPLAWGAMEELLDDLTKEQLADPEDVEAYRKNLQDLRQAPPETWFQNASLEATDSLNDALERSLGALEVNLSRPAQALALAESCNGRLTAAEREALQAQLRQSFEGLSSSELGLHPSRLSQLRSLDPGKLPSGDPAAAQALRQALSQNARALRELMDRSDALGKDWERRMLADTILGKAGGVPLNEPGQGGPSRGPGEAPIHYEGQPVDLKTDAPEALPGLDPERAAPGDLLSVETSRPEVKPGALPSSPAGNVSQPGQGGHQTWETTLLPSERAVLRRYFR